MSRPPTPFCAVRRSLRLKWRSGFTLIELLITIAVLSIVTGMVVALNSGAQANSEAKMIQSELAEIRKACQRFKLDMGEAPHFIAELLQSPDNAFDGRGGWPWHSVDANLRSYDPATGRGWNGPYLQAQTITTAWKELRIPPASPPAVPAEAARTEIDSPATASRAMLVSRYVGYPQYEKTGTQYSHYQLDFSNANEIYVMFVRVPDTPITAGNSDGNKVNSLGLGMKP